MWHLTHLARHLQATATASRIPTFLRLGEERPFRFLSSYSPPNWPRLDHAADSDTQRKVEEDLFSFRTPRRWRRRQPHVAPRCSTCSVPVLCYKEALSEGDEMQPVASGNRLEKMRSETCAWDLWGLVMTFEVGRWKLGGWTTSAHF